MKKVKLLLALSAISGAVLLAANLAATKIFSLFGIPVDAGLLIYPLTYITGDLILMVCEDDEQLKSAPASIAWVSMLINALIMVLIYITISLPAYPGWKKQESYAEIFGLMPRVVAGSLLGYIISSLVNIVTFRGIHSTKKIAELQDDNRFVVHEERALFPKAYGSSVIAKVFDVLIFEIVAFVGILPMKEFMIQAIFAYGIGLLAELPFSAIACMIYRKIEEE